MRFSAFTLAMMGLVAPAAMAQTAPQMAVGSRPLRLSQQECVNTANMLLRRIGYAVRRTDSTTVEGVRNGYTSQIFCQAPENVVLMAVGGPNRNTAQSYLNQLARDASLWTTASAPNPGPVVGQFDENFYLYNNPDVAQAVRQGQFANGRRHFEEFGLREGRDGNFNEAYYLRTYNDVAQAVQRGQFRNGLEHFQRFGRNEGRAGGAGSRDPRWNANATTPVNPVNPVGQFDELFYLANNPDVAQAVRQGQFRDGREHYERLGRNEGRAPMFDEQFYLARYPDVAIAIRSGQVRNAFEHWQRFGRAQNRPGGRGTLGGSLSWQPRW